MAKLRPDAAGTQLVAALRVGQVIAPEPRGRLPHQRGDEPRGLARLDEAGPVRVSDDRFQYRGAWPSVGAGTHRGDGGDGPSFRTGNRDTGLAVRSAQLAALLTEILKSDMVLATAGPAAVAAIVPEETMLLVERAPALRPTRLYPGQYIALYTNCPTMSACGQDDLM